MNSSEKKVLLLAAMIMIPFMAWSHDSGDVAGGLLSGVLHPISGLDHVMAMVAVGLWGAQLRGKAIWILPIAFPFLMAVGGAIGVAEIPIGPVEVFIALSSIVLGIMVLGAVKTKLWVAIVIVSFFAVFHGYAHGAELPQSVQPLAYGLGFVITTGLLHVSGIVIGMINKYKVGQLIMRVLGAVICGVGIYFLIQAF